MKNLVRNSIIYCMVIISFFTVITLVSHLEFYSDKETSVSSPAFYGFKDIYIEEDEVADDNVLKEFEDAKSKFWGVPIY